MKIAVQTAVIPGESIAEKYANAARLGFDGVEIAAWSFADEMSEHEEEIHNAALKYGIPTSSLCGDASGDFVHQLPEVRRERLERTMSNLRLAERLGARGLISVPIRLHRDALLPDLAPLCGPKELGLQLTEAILREKITELQSINAVLFLEPLNRYEANVLNQLQDALRVCRGLAHPKSGNPGDANNTVRNVQLLCDTFHAGIEEAEPYAALSAVPRNYLGHVHLADSNRLLPGQGYRDFKPFFRALKTMEYEGYMALECGIKGEPMAALADSLSYLRKEYEKA